MHSLRLRRGLSGCNRAGWWHNFAEASRRWLMIRPEGTKDPQRFPRGFVPLSGSEPIDVVYDMLKEGHFVAPTSTIESIHNVFLGVRKLLLSELPHTTYHEVVHFQRRHRELSSQILIQRNFWELNDYSDPESNQSFGVQNLYFDNLQWNQTLWKLFIQYVDRWFPTSDHSHLTYYEYLRLIKSFVIQQDGARVPPLLPKAVRLRPPLEVDVPVRGQREPLMLFRIWLLNFRRPLMLQRGLVVRGGCGVLAMIMRDAGVPMVRMTDPRPSAIEAARADSLRAPKSFHHLSFQVAAMFPEDLSTPRPDGSAGRSSGKRGKALPHQEKYDVIVYYPDQHIVNGFGEDGYAFAPGLSGFRGDLESFFEHAGAHLSEHGVVVICCTNFCSLAEPEAPHPIEYEVKVNRRWVILDYYDRRMSTRGQIQADPDGITSISLLGELRRKLQAELWVLHPLEAMQQFAHIHNIPGASAPSTAAAHWRHKGLLAHRRRAIKAQVELMGGNWGDYKGRLLSMLQSMPDEDEDETTQAVRMALDPTYGDVLALRSRKVVEAAARETAQFHERVAAEFDTVSPRTAFDEEASRRYPSLGVKGA